MDALHPAWMNVDVMLRTRRPYDWLELQAHF